MATELPTEMNTVICTGAGGPLALKTVPVPTPTGNEILIRVHAVSMNPIDFKVHSDAEEGRVLGYDCSGVVAATGPDSTLFKVGDAVMAAGNLVKSGTNSEYFICDERIVGRKPETLSHSEAAAMPLVSLTAWGGFFERAGLPQKDAPFPVTAEVAEPVVLIIAGAGGVGSAAIQIAKVASTASAVIATASRPESEEFCRSLGADYVINHHKSYKEELERVGFTGGVDYVLACVDLDKCYDSILEVLNPMGHIIALWSEEPIDVKKMLFKRQSLDWEMMFTRPMTGVNPIKQHELLNSVADLIDAGAIKTTMTSNVPYSLDALKEAHAKQKEGRMVGKQVLTLVADEA